MLLLKRTVKGMRTLFLLLKVLKITQIYYNMSIPSPSFNPNGANHLDNINDSLKVMDSTSMLPMVSIVFQASLARIFTYRRETSFVNQFLRLLNGFQLFQ